MKLSELIPTLIKKSYGIHSMDQVNNVFRSLSTCEEVSFVHYTARYSPMLFKPNSLSISTLDQNLREEINKQLSVIELDVMSAGTPIVLGDSKIVESNFFIRSEKTILSDQPLQLLVPISDIMQGRAFLIFGFKEQFESYDDNEWLCIGSTLYLLSKALHSAITSIHSYDNLAVPNQLQPDEILCLEHAAMGKTSEETSDILGIPVRTVRHLLSKAIAKLDTFKISQAIAKALLKGIIQADIRGPHE